MKSIEVVMEIDVEIKSQKEDGTFTAYGSTFGNEDKGGDVVVKGAFAKSLKEKSVNDIFMFYNHDTKEIIGEYTNIKEDDHGLLIEGKLFIDDIKRASETHFLMKKGLIKKFSIGYQVVKKSFKGGLRMLEELKLFEVSPVTFPMNEEANLLTVKKDLTKKDLEKALRDVVGLSHKEAKGLISCGWDGMQRDAVEHSKEQKNEADWSSVIQILKGN
jgi:HK97 family phage prohead protease